MRQSPPFSKGGRGDLKDKDEVIPKYGSRNIIADILWQSLLIVLIAFALSLTVNYLREGGVPLVKQRVSQSPGPGEQEAGGVPNISIDEARALYLTNGAVFIDARPEETYRAGHIKGALNLPADSLEGPLPAVMAQIPPDSLIITYCDGEDCPLGKEAALQLSAQGYTNVQVLENGWTLWQEAGLPADSDK